jgi:hypothetical protein
VGDCHFAFSRTYNQISEAAEKVMAVGMDWQDDDAPDSPDMDAAARKIQKSWFRKQLRSLLTGGRDTKEGHRRVSATELDAAATKNPEPVAQEAASSCKGWATQHTIQREWRLTHHDTSGILRWIGARRIIEGGAHRGIARKGTDDARITTANELDHDPTGVPLV